MAIRSLAFLTLVFPTCASLAPLDGGEKPAQALVRDRKVQLKTALAWLAKNQRQDGSWESGLGDNRPAVVVTTSFAALALLATDDSNYRDVVAKAAKFLETNILTDPPVEPKLDEQWDQSNWKVAIGGLFLCEYHATLGRNPAMRSPSMTSKELERLVEAVAKESCRRMEPSGGWGHTPRVKNALGYIEFEVMSNWMLATLSTARRIGVTVPADDLKRAVKYVEDCCDPKNGGVGYNTKELKEFGCPCRTGGAIFALATMGRSDHPIYARAAGYWRRELGNSGEGHGSVALGLLASALAARQLGDEAWQAYHNRFFPKILEGGNADGSFEHLTGSTSHSVGCDDKLGSGYNTGIYALILQLDQGKLHFLGRQQK